MFLFIETFESSNIDSCSSVPVESLFRTNINILFLNVLFVLDRIRNTVIRKKVGVAPIAKMMVRV
jgi:hypothetical protein